MIIYEHQVPSLFIFVALGIAAAVAIISAWWYLKINIPSIILIIIRLIFLILLGWCMFLPEKKEVQTHMLKPRFVIAVDTSKSMSLSPRPGVISNRWDDVISILNQPWKNVISAECDIDVYTFSSELGPKIDIENVPALSPEGNSTLLRESLQKLMDRYQGQNVTGFLLLTDGLDTKEAYDDWANEPWAWPVYTISLEPPDAWEVEGDLRVDTIKTPRRVTVQWTTELKAVISGQGTKGQPANVQLFKNGRLIQEIPTQIPTEGGSREVSFQLEHPEVGVFTYMIYVPPLPNESSTNDNTYSVSVQVVDARNRIMYVEGHPRWESKYLTRALQANANITPICFIRGPGGKFLTYGPRGSLTPDLTDEQLAAMKIIIIGNLDANELGEERAQNLLKFVEVGGSLVLLGGSRAWGENGLLKTSLKKLLPVKKVSITPEEGKFAVTLTDSGSGHPAFAGDPELWRVIPPVLSLFPNASISAGAEALVAAQTPEGAQPLVVVQRYGQGKVVAILTDSLWRWQLSPNANKTKPYQRFWDQLLSWLSPTEKELAPEQLEIFADREQLYLGEEISLSARYGRKTDAENAQNQQEPVVNCMIKTPDNRTIPFPMAKQNVTTAGGKAFPGYGIKFKAEQPGLHKAAATTDIGGKKITSDEISFFVKPFTPESMPRPVNTAVLKAISRQSGGKFFESLEDLNNTLSSLSFASREEESVSYISLWQTVLIISCLLTLLSIEWAIRKWRNMP